MDTPTLNLARSQCYVDGRWVGEPTVPVTNKATGEIMARVPDFGEAETRAAIEAAHCALPAWSKLLAKERSRLLRRSPRVEEERQPVERAEDDAQALHAVCLRFSMWAWPSARSRPRIHQATSA